MARSTPTILEALRPPDRLGAGSVIHTGYVPSNVADLVHCLNIGMWQFLKRQDVGDGAKIRRIKAEITWLINRCEKAAKRAEAVKP